MLRSMVLFIIPPLVSVWSGGAALAQNSEASSPYVLRTSVMGGGGVPMQGDGLQLRGTLSQLTPTGVCTETGTTLYAGLWRAWMDATVVGIEEDMRPPMIAGLSQNHPNPFSLTTSIAYTLAVAGPVEVGIYNIQGQLVRLLVSEAQLPGRHQVSWDGTSDQGIPVARGVYFYRLRARTFAEVKKMILLD